MRDPNRFLKAIYKLAEHARFISVDSQRLFDEENKADELSFYESLTRKESVETADFIYARNSSY